MGLIIEQDVLVDSVVEAWEVWLYLLSAVLLVAFYLEVCWMEVSTTMITEGETLVVETLVVETFESLNYYPMDFINTRRCCSTIYHYDAL